MTEPTTDPYSATAYPARSAAQPAAAPAEVQAQTQAPAQPVLAQPVKPRNALFGWAIAGFILVGISVLAVVAYLLLALGPGLLLLSGFLALIPLAIVLLGVRWIDRWEPEPRGLLHLRVPLGRRRVGRARAHRRHRRAARGVRRPAPIRRSRMCSAASSRPRSSRRSAKGLGVLLIFLVGAPVLRRTRRRHRLRGDRRRPASRSPRTSSTSADRSPTSGGFDGAVGEIFFVRGMLSPFAHVMFTSMTGLFIGLAARRSIRAASAASSWAAARRSCCTRSGTARCSVVYDFYGYYLIVQVPLFAGAIVLVVHAAATREAKLTQERLGEYAAAGWFNPSEVDDARAPRPAAGRRSPGRRRTGVGTAHEGVHQGRHPPGVHAQPHRHRARPHRRAARRAGAADQVAESHRARAHGRCSAVPAARPRPPAEPSASAPRKC